MAPSVVLLKSVACGFINITYGSFTTIALNGRSFSPGTISTVDGTGSCSTTLRATSITLTGEQSVAVIGTVASFDAAHVLLQTGGSCGLINALYDSKTLRSGPAFATGDVVFALGSGSCSTQIQATKIIVTSPATTTIGGTVSSAQANDLVVATGQSCANATLYFATTTKFTGPAAAVGSSVVASGTGSCATQLLATTIAVQAASATP